MLRASPRLTRVDRSEEFGWVYLKGEREFPDVQECRVALPALDASQVGVVHPGSMGEFLLGMTTCLT